MPVKESRAPLLEMTRLRVERSLGRLLRHRHPPGAPRLGQAPLKAGLQCAIAILGPRIRRQGDSRYEAQLSRQSANATNERQAVLVGHGDVADDDICPFSGQPLERFGR